MMSSLDWSLGRARSVRSRVKRHQRRRLRVLVVTSYFPPAYKAGGPLRTLDALIRRAEHPERYWVMTTNSDLGEPAGLDVAPGRWCAWHGAHVWYEDEGTVWGRVAALRAEVQLRPDVVYLNTLWGFRYSLMYLGLKKLKLLRAPVILAPRGQMSHAALAIESRKKRVFLALVHVGRLLDGVHVQASSEREAADIRRVLGAQVQVFVSLDESWTAIRNPSDLPSRPKVTHVVYVGRLSEIKGVHLFLEALTALDDTSSPLVVDVYGDALDESYERRCRRLAEQAGAGVRVTFHGPVPHAQVPTVFAEADLFVLPTGSENFGHVIGEALANGCPVAVPDTTPWTPAIEAGGGWLIADRSPVTLERLLREVSGMSREERLSRKLAALEAYRQWEREQATSSDGGFDALMGLLEAELDGAAPRALLIPAVGDRGMRARRS